MPLTPLDWAANQKETMMTDRTFAYGAALSGLAIAASAAAWFHIDPNVRVPVHWNFAGQADRWGSATQVLVLIPLMMLAILAIVTAMSRMSDFNTARDANRPAWRAAWMSLFILLAAAHGTALAAAMGYAPPLRALLGLMGVLLVWIGNTTSKTVPNRLIGARLGPLLRDPEKWSRANRLAGWGLSLTGIAVVIAAIATTFQVTIMTLIAGVVISALMGAWIAISNR